MKPLDRAAATYHKGKRAYRAWADDLVDRYNKKYRKYLGKPMSNHYVVPLGGLGTSQVSAAISPHQLATMSTTQAAQYQQMIQQQLMAQLAQQQAQQAAQALQNGQSFLTQATPTVSVYQNPANLTNYINYTTTSTASTTTCWPSSNGPTTVQVPAMGLGANVLPYVGPPSVESVLDRILKVRDGHACEIQLPDGSKIHVDDNGSYVVDDKDAKVVYKANRARDFNRFINVSDRIEEFFEFCGEQDVRADEMMELPMKLFVGWLVLKAAEADQEPPPADIKLIPDLRARRTGPPRCRGCGRFLRFALKKADISWCSSPCFEKQLAAAQPLALPAPSMVPLEPPSHLHQAQAA